MSKDTVGVIMGTCAYCILWQMKPGDTKCTQYYMTQSLELLKTHLLPTLTYTYPSSSEHTLSEWALKVLVSMHVTEMKPESCIRTHTNRYSLTTEK